MSTAVAQIDSKIDVITPENIAFEHRLAGPFRRLWGFLLDLLIKAVLYFALAWILMWGMALVGEVAIAVLLVAFFLLDWFYGGLFEAWWNGQTPGKWLMGIRVVTTDGRPINGLQAVMRTILRSVDMMPLVAFQNPGFFPVFTLGLLTMTLSRRYQRLGDIVCGTMVIVEERQWLTGVAQLEDPRAYQLASYLPADLEVKRSLALAVSHYVERRRFFSAARRREIASHLAAPLLRRFGLPADTSYDLLLCAIYYRTFVADRGEDEQWAARAREQLQPLGQAIGTPQPASYAVAGAGGSAQPLIPLQPAGWQPAASGRSAPPNGGGSPSGLPIGNLREVAPPLGDGPVPPLRPPTGDVPLGRNE